MANKKYWGHLTHIESYKRYELAFRIKNFLENRRHAILIQEEYYQARWDSRALRAYAVKKFPVAAVVKDEYEHGVVTINVIGRKEDVFALERRCKDYGLGEYAPKKKR